jgi:hypothetical protein
MRQYLPRAYADGGQPGIVTHPHAAATPNDCSIRGVDRDGGGRAAETVRRPRAGGRIAVDVVVMVADASGMGSGVGSAGVARVWAPRTWGPGASVRVVVPAAGRVVAPAAAERVVVSAAAGRVVVPAAAGRVVVSAAGRVVVPAAAGKIVPAVGRVPTPQHAWHGTYQLGTAWGSARGGYLTTGAC